MNPFLMGSVVTMLLMLGGGVAGEAFADGSAQAWGAWYRVPVSPELVPYAQFALATNIQIIGGEIQMKFTLPPELAGDSAPEVSLSGKLVAGEIRLSGTLGTATCLLETNTLVCSVAYDRLYPSEHAADTYLQAHYSDPTVLDARERVAATFGTDPIGVVTYPLTIPLSD